MMEKERRAIEKEVKTVLWKELEGGKVVARGGIGFIIFHDCRNKLPYIQIIPDVVNQVHDSGCDFLRLLTILNNSIERGIIKDYFSKTTQYNQIHPTEIHFDINHPQTDIDNRMVVTLYRNPKDVVLGGEPEKGVKLCEGEPNPLQALLGTPSSSIMVRKLESDDSNFPYYAIHSYGNFANIVKVCDFAPMMYWIANTMLEKSRIDTNQFPDPVEEFLRGLYTKNIDMKGLSATRYWELTVLEVVILAYARQHKSEHLGKYERKDIRVIEDKTFPIVVEDLDQKCAMELWGSNILDLSYNIPSGEDYTLNKIVDKAEEAYENSTYDYWHDGNDEDSVDDDEDDDDEDDD